MTLRAYILLLSLGFFLGACTKTSSYDTKSSKESVSPLSKGKRALLLTQAQFEWVIGADGKKKPKPGPAKLLILSQENGLWHKDIIEDPESRVFHKATCSESKNKSKTITTIGASNAHLKTWHHAQGRWQSRSHWQPTFGGKWDRLRDFELGDIDGDSKDEMVLATHDQGVIAVAEFEENTWVAQEISRKPNTFIHEIEIGDVDGDGKLEFYATPSDPNKSDHSQGGEVIAVYFENSKYRREQVATFPDRHAKEILVVDMDGDGRDELYVSLEARTQKSMGQLRVLEALEIRRYQKDSRGKWVSDVVATLSKGVQARVLLAGDATGRGKPEMIVTTWKDGLWLLKPSPKLPWAKESIDSDSSGFEHAAALFDIDGDGKNELYVAADDQDQVRQYKWKDQRFERQVIMGLNKSDLTWSIEGCR
jgi:hypothetical protein